MFAPANPHAYRHGFTPDQRDPRPPPQATGGPSPTYRLDPEGETTVVPGSKRAETLRATPLRAHVTGAELAIAALTGTAAAAALYLRHRHRRETRINERIRAAEQAAFTAGQLTTSQATFDAGYNLGLTDGHEMGSAGEALPVAPLADAC